VIDDEDETACPACGEADADLCACCDCGTELCVDCSIYGRCDSCDCDFLVNGDDDE
jgi:hypothetical protein